MVMDVQVATISLQMRSSPRLGGGGIKTAPLHRLMPPDHEHYLWQIIFELHARYNNNATFTSHSLSLMVWPGKFDTQHPLTLLPWMISNLKSHRYDG